MIVGPTEIQSAFSAIGPAEFAVPFNEVDRFGFSSLLNCILNGEYKRRRAYCNWLHGWKWYPVSDARMLGLTTRQINSKWAKHKPVVVVTAQQKSVLTDAGFCDVSLGPISYGFLHQKELRGISGDIVDTQKNKQRTNLVFLPKAQSGQNIRRSFRDFVDWCNQTDRISRNSVLCVYHPDFLKPKVREILTKQKIPVTLGANPGDRFSILRQASMLSNFDSVATNTIGTHIPISLSFGKEIEFVDEVYDTRTVEDFISDSGKRDDVGDDKNYFEYMEHVHSLQFFLNQHGWVFNRATPVQQKIKWAKSELGVDNMVEAGELRRILGWTLASQSKSNIYSVLSRIERLGG